MEDRALLEDFVRRMPKTETHLHLEGALPYRFLVELDSQRFPPEPEFRLEHYRFASFVDFENVLISHAAEWFRAPERYFEAAKAIFADHVERNVRYVETSFHLPIAEFMGFDPRQVAPAIRAAVPEGLEVRIVAGMARNSYSPILAEALETLHRWEEVDGIDVHGQEWLDLEDWAIPLWRRFKEEGKIVKAHAGEFGGPEKIYEALDRLGAERIQHGVRAVEDADLVRRLAGNGVVLDTCPISNVRLGVFESLESHPIRQLIEAGVACTINTDDPLCFANTIDDEYLALARRLDFTARELAEIAKTGFEHARLDREAIRRHVDEIDRMVESYA